MSDITIKPGDVYCPRCLSNKLEWQVELPESYWYCHWCGEIEQPYNVDENGRFTWVWSDEYPPDRPGCPWCGTRNYTTSGLTFNEDDDFFVFVCMRLSCNKKWRGDWNRYNDDWKTDRWRIRIPVWDVPWRSGTIADLECARRSESGFIDCDPACCRWPKSCRAFDAGYKTGFGPTVLPVIWNDGYGWRSGSPDITQIPKHLVDQIVTRWRLATGDTSE